MESLQSDSRIAVRYNVNVRADGEGSYGSHEVAPADASVRTEKQDTMRHAPTRQLDSSNMTTHRARQPDDTHRAADCFTVTTPHFPGPCNLLCHPFETHQCDAGSLDDPTLATQISAGGGSGGGGGGNLPPVHFVTGAIDVCCEGVGGCSQRCDPHAAEAAHPDLSLHIPSFLAPPLAQLSSGAPMPAPRKSPKPPTADDPFHDDWPHW